MGGTMKPITTKRKTIIVNEWRAWVECEAESEGSYCVNGRLALSGGICPACSGAGGWWHPVIEIKKDQLIQGEKVDIWRIRPEHVWEPMTDYFITKDSILLQSGEACWRCGGEGRYRLSSDEIREAVYQGKIPELNSGNITRVCIDCHDGINPETERWEVK